MEKNGLEKQQNIINLQYLVTYVLQIENNLNVYTLLAVTLQCVLCSEKEYWNLIYSSWQVRHKLISL